MPGVPAHPGLAFPAPGISPSALPGGAAIEPKGKKGARGLPLLWLGELESEASQSQRALGDLCDPGERVRIPHGDVG